MTAPALLGPLDADPRARGRTASMTLLVMRVTLQENVRRRGALALALLLPLVFFLARIDAHWTALRLLAIGLGWAAATLSLFTTVSSRRVDRRLAVSGARPTALVVGRYAAVLLRGWLIAAVYAAIVALSIGDRLVRPAFVLPMLLLTVAVSVPLGSLAAALVPRDLEGALLLLAVMALQLLVDPVAEWTRALPLWSTRELASYVVENLGGEAGDYMRRGLVHGAGFTLGLTGAGWLGGLRRLRPIRLPEPRPGG